MKKTIRAAGRIIYAVDIILLAIVVVFIVLQVIFRYAGISAPWTQDLSQYAFIILVLFGASIVSYEKKHIQVEVLVKKLSPRGQKVMECVCSVLVILFLVFFLKGLITVRTVNASSHVPSAIFIKLGLLYTIFIVADIMMIITEFFCLLRVFIPSLDFSSSTSENNLSEEEIEKQKRYILGEEEGR